MSSYPYPDLLSTEWHRTRHICSPLRRPPSLTCILYLVHLDRRPMQDACTVAGLVGRSILQEEAMWDKFKLTGFCLE